MLQRWRRGLLGAGLLALSVAPPAVFLTILVLAPVRLLRARSSACPRALHASWFALEADTGRIRVAGKAGDGGEWWLRDWFRHIGLIILYLERAPREYGCLVLARDGMEPSAWRRLYYLLGVSTVGAGSSRGSG